MKLHYAIFITIAVLALIPAGFAKQDDVAEIIYPETYVCSPQTVSCGLGYDNTDYGTYWEADDEYWGVCGGAGNDGAWIQPADVPDYHYEPRYLSRELWEQELEITFNSDGLPAENTAFINGEKVGRCTVDQWGTLVHDIVEGTSFDVNTEYEATTATIGHHRFEVNHGTCEPDPFLGFTSEGFCCNQRLSKVNYTFKKHCTIGALMATCGPAEWDPADSGNIKVLRVTLFRQCGDCEHGANGCSAHGYCGLPSPYSNQMPAAMLCDRMCQPNQHGKCRPRHIFSELTSHMADQITEQELELIRRDPDYKELSDRCQEECIPTVPLNPERDVEGGVTDFEYACVQWNKNSGITSVAS